MVRVLGRSGIESGAALFDGGEGKARGIGDSLKEIGVSRVRIGSWNGRVLPFEQIRNRLRENETGIQVRVVFANAIAGPPAGVHSELGQIGAAQLSARSSSAAAGHSA